MTPSPYTDRYSRGEIDEYYRTGMWADETFYDLLARRAQEMPDKVFVTDGSRAVTYGELRDSVDRLAIGLHRRGWRAGDTAAVQLPNWVEFIEVLAALSRLGVIGVPIMPIYRSDEVRYVLTNASIKGAFTPSTFKKFDYLAMYRELRSDVPDLTIFVARPDESALAIAATDNDVSLLSDLSVDDGEVSELPTQPSPDDHFVIVYTSGTTSRPKGCVHTFNTYCSGARSLATAFGYTSDDVQFGPSPIAHTTGLVTSVLLPMLAGASSHLMPSWDPERGVEDIERYGCTATVTATTFLHTLLGAYDPARHNLSSLRVWTCAGSPIPTAVVEHAGEVLPELRVLSLYGRSENLVTTTCSVTDHVERALTSDGTSVPGAEVQVVDANGEPVAPGAEGDIAYRGPSHMIEYLGNPSETTKLFTPEGFSMSGDLGVMTDDGYVRVTGRTKDIVIRGGMNISVREVEELLVRRDDLDSVSVVGMPDERLGERVCCYLVAANGHPAPSVDDLRDYLVGHGMAIQKTPERVVAVDALPMTATGKVLKHELRKNIAELLKTEADSTSVAGPR